MASGSDQVQTEMKRPTLALCAILGAVVPPAPAVAAGSGLVRGAVTGKITYLGDAALSIQTGGRRLGVINAMTATADVLSRHVYPYVYGGGHAEAGIASIGIRGPGYNGRRRGYDCSGSVAAVLAGAGLWQPGSGVPNDAGIVQQLLGAGMIARGPGRAPDEVTLYDYPGVHIFMNIDGRFFGTSDGGGGNAKGGPTWLYDGAPDSWSHLYRRYHFLPSVLRNRTTYGQSFTFQTTRDPQVAIGGALGDRVRVSYTETRSGAMNASAILWVGASVARGTVSAIAADGATVTLQTAAGQTLTYAMPSAGTSLTLGLQLGDGVRLTYSRHARALIVHTLTVTSSPAGQPPAASAPTTPAADPQPGPAPSVVIAGNAS